ILLPKAPEKHSLAPRQQPLPPTRDWAKPSGNVSLRLPGSSGPLQPAKANAFALHPVDSPVTTPHSEFQISNFCFQISDFEFQISNSAPPSGVPQIPRVIPARVAHTTPFQMEKC